VAHDLTLEVEVVNIGARTTYALVCSGVSELRFANSILGPWSYAEVTAVHTSQTASGKWMVEVVLWSEDCELMSTCDAFKVTELS
jgi:hypothetical protein